MISKYLRGIIGDRIIGVATEQKKTLLALTVSCIECRPQTDLKFKLVERRNDALNVRF